MRISSTALAWCGTTRTRSYTSRVAKAIQAISRFGAISCAVLAANLCYADTTTELLADQITQAATADKIGFSNGSTVLAPIPFRNELVGAGLALGAGYLLKTDAQSDTSIIGAGALRSENGSTAAAVAANFAFAQNTWKLNMTAGQADMFYDLYIGNLKFPVQQEGVLFKAQALHQFWPQIHAGAQLRYLDTTLSYARAGAGKPALPLIRAELVSIAALLQWDSRDDTFSARSGHYLDVEAMYGDVINTARDDYAKVTARYSAYRPVGDRHSLAFHVAGCSATSSTPFFDKCSLGGTDGFRGFNPTRFLNSRLLSFQGEYRHSFSNRISGVAFAGVGYSGPTFDLLDNAGANTAAGFGVRYQLSKDFKAMFSVDVARNDAGDDTLYVYVGQRF